MQIPHCVRDDSRAVYEDWRAVAVAGPAVEATTCKGLMLRAWLTHAYKEAMLRARHLMTREELTLRARIAMN